MTSADEFALSLYIPLILLLALIELVLGIYKDMWNKKFAAGKLLLNMCWTCTLFPLFLDVPLFTQMIESLYEGRPKVGPPISGDGFFWLSAALVCLLFLVNTIDVYEGYQLAEQSQK